MSEENLKQIKISIQKYCKDADRDPEDVILIGASKSQSVDKINVAYEAGLNHFGENYLQEAENKIALTNKDITWHFIGAIQTRKAKKIAELFDWVHTVENIRVAERLNSARPTDKPPLNVCIQLNIDEEDTKSGIKKEELENLITSLSHLENLVVISIAHATIMCTSSGDLELLENLELCPRTAMACFGINEPAFSLHLFAFL